MSHLRNGSYLKRNTRGRLMACLSYDGHCPHCGFEMTMPRPHRPAEALTATIDHIRPLAGGGADGIENLRLVCLLCNQSRAAASHCVGAMACVRAVLNRKRPPVRDVARLWIAWRVVSPRRKSPAAAPE